MTDAALKILEKLKTYVNMGYSWDHTPHDLAAIACFRLEMYNRSLRHAKDALLLDPQNKRLQNNFVLISAKCGA